MSTQEKQLIATLPMTFVNEFKEYVKKRKENNTGIIKVRQAHIMYEALKEYMKKNPA